MNNINLFNLNSIKNHIIILILISIGIYFNTLFNDFVWEDATFITNEPRIKSFSNFIESFKSENFIKDFSKEKAGGFFFISRSLSFFIDYKIWNLRPFGYHLTNILLNTLCILFLYYFFTFLNIGNKTAFFAAILYAVNPLRVETIAYIKNRFYIIAFILILVSLIIFISEKKYYLSLLAFVFGILSKEIVSVFFPFLLLLYIISFKNISSWKKNIIKVIPFFIVSGIYIYFTQFYIKEYEIIMPIKVNMNLSARFILFINSIIEYFKSIIFPFDLSVEKNIFINSSDNILFWIFSGFLLLALLMLFINLYFWDKKIFFSFGFILVSLFPVLNILPKFGRLIAEQRLFIPVAGYSLFIVLMGKKIKEYLTEKNINNIKKINRTFLVIFISVLSLFSTRTILRNLDWKNDWTIWFSTLKSGNVNARVYNNVGRHYFINKDLKKARYYFELAIIDDKYFSDAYNNLGLIEMVTGNYSTAKSRFMQAMKCNPYSADVINNYTSLLILEGDYKTAERITKQSINKNRQKPELYLNLSNIYNKLNLIDDELISLQKAYSLNPNEKYLIERLGKIYYEKKDYKKAKYYYEKIFKEKKPETDLTAYLELGNIYFNLNLFKKSKNVYNRYLLYNPLSKIANLGIGIMYIYDKKYNKSINYFYEALKNNPDDPFVLSLISISLSNMGKTTDAKKFSNRSMKCLKFLKSIKYDEKKTKHYDLIVSFYKNYVHKKSY